ncbi:hypothetical protein K1W69_17560 [Hoeflea sp. WL0058]|uniref:Uncharacterized protein n=1 Tax=Flavimaribacter sediminis TaxID=2865987 RepID=A0AAE3D2X2_9HYPH|nr:hypothetical protein [Flavimaribacter sediminis]MBW8639008.1 hypothetical protein [Flavimaribacter sediminis]
MTNVSDYLTGYATAEFINYYDRVIADGGQIGSPAECAKTFRLLESKGLISSLVGGVGAGFGYKLDGGYVTKLYDLVNADLDQTPSAQALQSTITTTDGVPYLTLDGSAHTNKPYFRSVTGSDLGTDISFFAAATLDDAANDENHIAAIEESAGSRRVVVSSLSNSGDPRTGGSLRREAGTTQHMYMKNFAPATSSTVQSVGMLVDGATGVAMYINGECEKYSTTDAGDYLDGRTAYMTTGNVQYGLLGKFRWSVCFSGGDKFKIRSLIQALSNGS